MQDEVGACSGLQRAGVGCSITRPDRQRGGLIGIDGPLVDQAHLIGANLAGPLDDIVGVRQDIGAHGPVNPIVDAIAQRHCPATGERHVRADDQVSQVAAGAHDDAAGAVRVGDGGPTYSERVIVVEIQDVGAANRKIVDRPVHVQLHRGRRCSDQSGTAPNDQDAAVFQLPDPPSQLSEVTKGRAKGWKPKT